VSTRLVFHVLAVALVTLTAVARPHSEATAAPALDVPLRVRDVSGVDRHREPCSTGVPLPYGLLREPDGIAVVGPGGRPVAAQFRVLERWREAGQEPFVKWVLVTFLADVPAGGEAVYRLRQGENPRPASPLDVQEASNVFHVGNSVVPKDLTGPIEILLTDADGATHTTSDRPFEWTVCEGGPLRVCLKAESPTTADRFGLTVWIRGYAGLDRVDLTVVLANTPREPRGPLAFRDFSVACETSPEAGRYLFGGEWGKPVEGHVGQGESAYLYQASDGTESYHLLGPPQRPGLHAFTLNWKDAVWKPGVPALRGYRVMQGEKEVASGHFAAGWAAVQTPQGLLVACVRHFRQNWPKAVEVRPGRLVLRLWPQYWQGHGGLHWLDDLQRKAHDLSFRTLPASAGAREAEAASRAFDAPLFAHCGHEWYRQSGAVDHLPADLTSREPKVIDTQEPVHDNWVTVGGDVSDRIKRRYHQYSLDPFVRSGDPRDAYRLRTGLYHSSCITPMYVDDYRYPRDADLLTHRQYCSDVRDAGTYRPGTAHHGYKPWNAAHFLCRELFDGWRLFGHPLARDAAADITTYLRFYADFRAEGGPLIAGTRADGHPLGLLCEAYRAFGDPGVLQSAGRLADVAWKQVDKQRGNYGVMDKWEHGEEQIDKPFMVCQVVAGLRAYYDLTTDERTLDQVTGMLDFILDEATVGDRGWTYVVKLAPGKQAPYRAETLEQLRQTNGTSYTDLAQHFAWAHRFTGEMRYRRAIDAIDPNPYPHRSRAYTAYYPERADTEPPARVTDLKAEALGSGSVRLTWTVPADAMRYQLKWAAKPMVRRCWPDRVGSHANWWAAANVPGEPEPAPTGRKQTMVVEGVSPGRRYFAVRAWDAGHNRSAISNIAEVTVR